ncbi:MAG: hypothetical protein KJ063_14325 [Anaerolineae bacterium]|nr:hypothetical protein [Anaerolineae bacterium]
MHGPQGVGIGHAVVSEWFDAMPMWIAIQAMAGRRPDILVCHHIDWLNEQGEVYSSIGNAALIETREGKVFSYRRVADGETFAAAFTPIIP